MKPRWIPKRKPLFSFGGRVLGVFEAVTIKEEKPKVIEVVKIEPAETEEERYKRLAGDLALSEEEIEQRRMFNE